MSNKKTPNLNLHSWAGTDNVKRTEFNENFSIIDGAISQKSDKSYVDTQIANVTNGSPKATFATLAALQAAFPAGTTGIYLVTADGKWYYWSGSAWAAGGTYQSTGIADGTVRPSATNFLERITNLFYSATITTGGFIDKSTGNFQALTGYSCSDFISITPGGTYTFSDSFPVNFGAVFDSNHSYIAPLPDGTGTSGSPVTPRTITINTPNAAYMRFNFYSHIAASSYIVSEGNALKSISTTEKLQFTKSVSAAGIDFSGLALSSSALQNGAVTPNKTTFLQRVTNLFNSATATSGGFIHKDTGVFQSLAGNSCSDFIPITQGGTYTFSDSFPINFGAVYDANKNYVGPLPDGSGITTSPVTPRTITVSTAGAAYIRFNFYNSHISASAYIVSEGSTLQSPSTTETLKLTTPLSAAGIDFTGTQFSGNTLQDSTVGYNKLDFITKTTNLFDASKATNGGFINKNTGAFQALGGNHHSDYIPIENGSSYTFSDCYPQNYGAIYDSNKNYLGPLPDGQTSAPIGPRTIAINTPGAAYIRFNFHDRISASVYMVVKGTSLPSSYVAYFSGFSASPLKLVPENLTDAVLAAIAALLPDSSGRWAGKKGAFDGDSIVDGQVIPGDTVKTTYPILVKDILLLSSVVNNAVSGSSLAVINGRRNVVDHYQELPADADFYYIAVGVNDFSYSAPLGTESSTDKTTFWGALNTMIGGMMALFPTKTIILATPIHKGGDTTANGAGAKLIDYVNAIRQAGDKWGIPICDMYKLSGLNPNVPEQQAALFYPDTIHPYTHAGLQRLADRAAGFIKSLA